MGMVFAINIPGNKFILCLSHSPIQLTSIPNRNAVFLCTDALVPQVFKEVIVLKEYVHFLLLGLTKLLQLIQPTRVQSVPTEEYVIEELVSTFSSNCL
jgi:hypothetical protein